MLFGKTKLVERDESVGKAFIIKINIYFQLIIILKSPSSMNFNVHFFTEFLIPGLKIGSRTTLEENALINFMANVHDMSKFL